MSLFIDFNPKLTKAEKILFQKIIKDFLNLNKTIYKIDDFQITELKNNTIGFLERFSKKGISYKINDNYGTLLPISYYNLKNDTVEFFLNSTFQDALLEKNFFKELHLKSSLLFSECFTKKFFYMFFLENIHKSEFSISIEEFKNHLGLIEYERFYDFEKNILKKIKNDIDTNTNYNIEFEKEKKNDFKNSKVTGLTFKLIDKNFQEKIKLTNFLISLISVKINDYKRLFDIIYKNLKNHHRTEIELVIQKASKEVKKNNKNFEDTLEDLLNKKRHFQLLAETSNVFSNPIELENKISAILHEIKKPNFLESEFASTQFLMKLYFSKEGEELIFQKNGILLSIKYYKKSKSFIKIYETD